MRPDTTLQVWLQSGGIFTEHPEVLRGEHSEQEVDVMFRRQQAAQRAAFKCGASWTLRPCCTRRDFFFFFFVMLESLFPKKLDSY